MMKAMVMTAFGGPEVLQLQEVPTPVILAHDLLVEVKATALNPVDCKTRNAPRWGDRKPPMILGFDVCGVVREVGPDACGFEPGDEIYASPSIVRNGANAELVCVDSRVTAIRPHSLSIGACAALPLAVITAWESLHLHAKIRSADTVLIQGGAGGVGHLAVRLAKLAGATVVATAGRPESIAAAQKMGADHVIDYSQGDVTEQVMDVTLGRGCDVVFDTVGGEGFTELLACAAPSGRVVTIVPGIPTDGFNTLFARNVSVHFAFMGMPAITGKGLEYQAHVLRAVARLADAGLIEPIIAEILPLADLATAHKRQESQRTIGKIVLKP